MLKALLKKQLTEIFRGYFINRKTGKGRTKGAAVALLCLFGVLMLFLVGVFFLLAMTLAQNMVTGGMDWLYFSLMGLIAVLFGTFGSVFNTYAGLYLSRDNDLLISMPIPSRTIVLSRVLGVFGLSLLYSMSVWIPTVVCYLILKMSAGALFSGIVCGLMNGLLITVISCLLGWVVALISGRLKNKSFITVLITLVLLAVYYLFCFNSEQLIGSLLNNTEAIGGFMKTWGALLAMMGRGASGEIGSLVSYSLICLALAAICFFVLEKTFIRIATRTNGVQKKNWKGGKLSAGGVRQALLAKEARRFTSSATYMLNMGLGLILMPAVAVFLATKSETALTVLRAMTQDASGMDWLWNMLPLAAFLLISLLGAINCISTPSVSLEGKTLWQIRSLPVKSAEVLAAKVGFGAMLNGGASLISALILLIAYQVPLLRSVLVIAAILLNVLLNSILGLILGLKHPILNWVTESTPIKQSVTVLVSLLLGWLSAALVSAAGFFAKDVMSIELFLLLACAVLALADTLLVKWVGTKGTRIFDAL